MSLYIDHKYVSLVSPRLDKFKRKNQKTYNFRCPICGDSSKSKIKARGYFYIKGNKMYFCCHNCNINWTFGHFLKEVDKDLEEQYRMENYRDTENVSSKSKDTFNEFDFTPDFKSNVGELGNLLFDYSNLNDLPDTHYAKQYIQKRQIPKKFWSSLFFVPDFKELVDKVEPDSALVSDDPRIIIPFYDEDDRLIAFQGRSFKKNGARYITIKVVPDAPKIYGLDRVDTDNRVYVLEGPFDAMFIDNAIATAGSNLNSKILEFKDSVFIFDNERRSVEIVKQMEKVVDQNRVICVWPESVKEKDINDLVLAGRTPKQIQGIIDNNMYQGMAAKLAISEWKRV